MPMRLIVTALCLFLSRGGSKRGAEPSRALRRAYREARFDIAPPRPHRCRVLPRLRFDATRDEDAVRIRHRASIFDTRDIYLPIYLLRASMTPRSFQRIGR